MTSLSGDGGSCPRSGTPRAVQAGHFTRGGGVGKTRLALHLAADLQRSFTDGVWLAELSVLRNAELPARTVAASLGLPDEATGDPVDAQPAPRHPSPRRLATLPVLIVIVFD